MNAVLQAGWSHHLPYKRFVEKLLADGIVKYHELTPFERKILEKNGQN